MAAQSAEQKIAREEGVKAILAVLEQLGPPRDKFGSPLVRISASCTELVPTVQYGNTSVGPVVVERWVVDAGDDSVKAEIKKLQAMVESAVAEDRQTLHEQLRAKAAAGG